MTIADDSGPGSLRQAILDANATTSGGDSIFITATVTIQPQTPLPAITSNRTEIAGAAQNVVLDGTALSESSTEAGLRIESNLNIIRGIGIVNFPADGILLRGDENKVLDCGIGYAGIVGQGNGNDGIVVQGNDNEIGSANENDRNIISGNGRYGIYLSQELGNNSTGRDTVVLGNYIGTNATGDVAVPNGSNGIRCFNCIGFQIGDNATGAGNLISGNSGGGISVTRADFIGNAPVMNIAGNYIGLDAAGSDPLGNGGIGIQIATAYTYTIGGSSLGAGNVISGNGDDGLRLESLTGVENEAVLVEGNYIGTDAVGSIGVPNEKAGIRINGEKILVIDNLISGNMEQGITFAELNVEARENTITANRIGVNASGDPLGNSLAGIRLRFGSYDNLIGGDSPLDGNVIAHNAVGIQVEPEADGNTFSRNSIYDNSGLGISIAVDTQDNIAPPVLDALGVDLIPTGTGSVGDTVQIFVDDADEGEIFIEEVPVHANGTFTGTQVLGAYTGMFVTATATDAAGNTSAFSTPVIVNPNSEGEGETTSPHSADYNPQDFEISLSELLRVIQFYNTGELHCDGAGEDGYAPGPGAQGCATHASDYSPQDWSISLSELLRLIQFFNSGGYQINPAGEDGYVPGI